MENIALQSLKILYTLGNHILKSDCTFSQLIQKYTKFANFTGLYFPHFATKHYNFTKFRMLFSAVLMNIPNSKVCLKGNRPLNSNDSKYNLLNKHM